MKYLVSIFVSFLILLPAGCKMMDSSGVKSLKRAIKKEELSVDTIIKGLKEALRIGSKKAVNKLSVPGGYGKDPLLRIPIPKDLENLADTLKKIGMGPQVDAFEDKMNEAAEHAATQAVPIFIDAIKQMTFKDARKILKGNNTAATDYFKKKTTDPLKNLYMPIVKEQMNEVGVVKRYNKLVKKYNSIPLTKKIDFSLEVYITDKALKGLFKVLEDVEKDIRTDPAARTTKLLKRVFAK